MQTADPSKITRQATILRILLPFAAGYFLSYLFRVVNAVIGASVATELQLDASDLGLLTSAYFLTFAAMQLPLGVMLDSWGPRRSEAGLLLFAALGAVVFSLSDSLSGLVAGRALIGIGVSACLMASFKAFVMWFPPQRLPQVNGIQMAAGGLGALTGAGPTEFLLHFLDWRGLFLGLALVAVLVAVAIFLWVPTHPHELRENRPSRLGDHLVGVVEVFTSALFWRVAPITVASQASFLAIQSLWTGPWLRDQAQMTPADIGAHLTLIAGAMVAGFLSMGWLSSRLAMRGIPPMRTAIVGIVGFTLVQLVIIAGGAVSPWWWLLFGFLGTAGIIPYAALSQQFPAALAGRVNTALNLLVFVAAFALQWGIGGIIDAWTPPGTRGYAPAGYQFAFAAVWSLQILGLIWYFGDEKIKKLTAS